MEPVINLILGVLGGAGAVELIRWWRGRGQDSANTNKTNAEALVLNIEMVKGLSKTLDETTVLIRQLRKDAVEQEDAYNKATAARNEAHEKAKAELHKRLQEAEDRLCKCHEELMTLTKTASKAEGKLEERDEHAERDKTQATLAVEDPIKVELVDSEEKA